MNEVVAGALWTVASWLLHLIVGAAIVVLTMMLLVAAGLAARSTDHSPYRGHERRHRRIARALWDVADACFGLFVRLVEWIIKQAERVRAALRRDEA